MSSPLNLLAYAFGDVNGDGNSDLLGVVPANQAGYVLTNFALSNGYNVNLPTGVTWKYWTAPAIPYNTLIPVSFGDFSGDGRTDILYKYDSTGKYNLLKFSGNGFIENSTTPWLVPAPLYTGNFRGRQKVDVISGTSVYNFGQQNNDELIKIKSPLGGSISITYGTSAGQANTKLPTLMSLVKTITTDDGRGNLATTTNYYDTGTWNYAERQFMGFQKVTTVLPCIAGEIQ